MNSFAPYLIATFTRVFPQHLHRMCGLIVMAACLLLPNAAHCLPLFGAWVGQAQVGERLKVNMTLFGLNKDAQSQLKSSCMEAWAESDGSESNSIQTRVPLNLDYGKTLDRGGLVTLSSDIRINDPVIKVHLASNCPLVTFVQTWDLQLDFGPKAQARPRTNSELSAAKGNALELAASSEFNLAQSASLAASYKKPAIKSEPMAAIKAKEVPFQPYGVEKVLDKPVKRKNEPTNPNLVRLPHTNEELALVQPPVQNTQAAQLENMAMNRSEQSPTLLQADQPRQGWASDPALTGDETNLMPFVIFGGVSLIMIAFGVWWGQRQNVHVTEDAPPGQGLSLKKLLANLRKQSTSQAGVSSSPSTQENPSQALQNQFSSNKVELEVEHQVQQTGVNDSDSDVNVAAFNKQLFESFLGNAPVLDEANEGDFDQTQRNQKSLPAESKSLVSMVSAFQNVSLGAWKLPEPYQSFLPASASKGLAADQVSNLILKCEMGFIELAFLNAQRGTAVDSSQLAEMLEVLDPDKIHRTIEFPNQPPSDLIKDLVRSKLCELSNKQEVQKFIESMHSMHDSECCEKLCLAHSAWSEFMKDLEVN